VRREAEDMRAVLDTNVIVSGLLAKGSASRILNLFEKDGYEICLTPKILEEVKRVLAYPKIARGLRKADVVSEEAIEWLLQHSLIFKDVNVIKLITEDPTDFWRQTSATDQLAWIHPDRFTGGIFKIP
jgi:putative PIN family toxin of toxin-antitoxin system